MAKSSKPTARPKKGRRRRSLVKHVFRRHANEDRLEYIARLAVVPVFVVTMALVYGLTVPFEGRRAYLNTLTSSLDGVTDYVAGLFSSGTDGSSSGTGPSADQGGQALSAETPAAVDAQFFDSTLSSTEAAIMDSTIQAFTRAIPAEGTTYIVKRGELLTDIARSFYGDAEQWRRIWYYNLERLPQPNDIEAGMELFIPPPGALTEAENARIQELLEENA